MKKKKRQEAKACLVLRMCGFSLEIPILAVLIKCKLLKYKRLNFERSFRYLTFISYQK